jgi:hypothetical protein
MKMETTLPLSLGVNGGYFAASFNSSEEDFSLFATKSKRKKSLKRLHPWSYVLHFNVA